MAKREQAAPAGAETRLVYSTGGEAPVPGGRGAGGTRPGGARPKAASHAAAAGGGKGIRVRLERRPGGRDITTVLGVPGRAEVVASLARDLRAACGAGGTVRDGVIELQGDRVDTVRRALAERGVKSR
jgi:translation initiation factor 1